MTDIDVVEPQPVPINAVFADDFSELLILVDAADSMTQVAAKVAEHAEGLRVRPRDLPKVVFYQDRQIPDHTTVAEAGIQAMEHVRVDYQE